MLRHILTTFYRSALSSQFQLITIVFGLTMGIVVSLLIYIYVDEESSYDQHHVRAIDIYRVNTTLDMEGKVDATAKAGLNTGEALMEFYPEIENYTQVLNVQKQTIKVNTDLYASEKVVYTDSTFFDVFTYEFVTGNSKDALIGPNKAVISKNVALHYFGSEGKAMGSTMKVNNNDFLVNGIYDQGAGKTHLPYEIFLSLSTLPKDFLQQRNREYMWLTTYNYIQLRPGVDINAFQSKLKSFHEKFLIPYVEKNQVNGAITHHLQAVSNIHLNDKLRFDFPGATNPNYLRIFSAVAMLTLFIALINYINLTTAQVSKRVKEIGIKKSIGASRLTLLWQFLAETVITVSFSFLLALALLFVMLPELNKLTDKTFHFFQIVTLPFLLSAALFIVLFGILAGLYPAILLSSFKPIQALQSTNKIVGATLMERIINPGFVRKALVTLQFGISVFLIIGTIVILQQFKFMQTHDMGFDQEQVMVIDIPNDTTVSNKLDVIKNTLLGLSTVKSVSSSSNVPGTNHGALTMNVSQSGGSEIKVINTYFTDEKFIETLDIELINGRFFSKEFSTDPQQAFVVNEAAAKFLGWENPIDKKIVSPLGQDGKIVGVVKDFNYKSLHSAIEPLILMNTPQSQGFLLIRIATSGIHETVAKVSALWKAFDSAHPYEYFFLDEKFQDQYVKEERLVKIFIYFSTLAILISCLGLIGLAIFTNELKTKEIAIRKTLGASHLQVLKLLSKDFLILILLANAIAWPVSYFLISNWLSQFAYQTSLNVFPFLLGMLIAFMIALLTISYFANKAARQGIIGALKHD
jgi:putative ABC transport system permease protein